MKAVVFHGAGDIRVDDVPEPAVQDSNDAIVRLTATAICGTDLHYVRGTFQGMQEGTILGREGIGIVEDLGKEVRNFQIGDRVVVLSTIACGYCHFCRRGLFSQCDNANPNGPGAGTAFFGGPQSTGPFNGMQAELVRVPFANVGMFKVPDDVTDDQAVLLSDIFPTGYFGADLADVCDGDTVAVFGCGPVGQFAIISCLLRGADRVIAIDQVESRLETARALGAEVINFKNENPVQTIRAITGGIGVDKAIDAVGIDAVSPASEREMFQRETEEIRTKESAEEKASRQWRPGNAPTQVLQWIVQSIAKAGAASVIGVYPPGMRFFPFGSAFGKNLTLRAGNCNHRRYISMLMHLVASDAVDPCVVLTEKQPFNKIIDAYRLFDEKKPGWLKVELEVAQAAAV